MIGDHRLPERFWAKVREDPESGCWLWAAATTGGYGRWSVGRKAEGNDSAHRVAYRALVGEIPPDREVDHSCHNRSETCKGGPSCPHRRCVNPAHLELATPHDNKLRGVSPPAVNARKTHCSRAGHPLSGSNLMPRKSGKRDCRECARKRDRDRRARRRATRS